MNIANDNDTNAPMPSPTWKPEPRTIDLDPSPIPDQGDETGHEDTGKPPARAGQSEKSEKPTEAAGADNPVHHSGRVPPSVT
ncbi:hypothetical protein OE766_14300 [Pararhizobium sp. YC-54]|uniref:hypothetical protein n=1 Tax=Pararhizobium sp. YC-54 TaxID=2986920 RepID=UPI0021F75EEE|nr:hypothetical protein [Pararhizobium sp. YC-54]MCV9999417.1 hypothetical protein [Pararhizobium sp. YC-54]